MSEYKYKEEIMDDVSFEPAFQYPHELNTHNAKVEEIKEVYVKANLWNMNRKRMDDWQKKAEAFDELSALIAKRYEAEKDRAGYTADQYTQGVYYTLNNLNGVAKDLESGDAE